MAVNRPDRMALLDRDETVDPAAIPGHDLRGRRPREKGAVRPY